MGGVRFEATNTDAVTKTDDDGEFMYSSSADESNEVKLWWGSDASDEDGSFVFLSNARDGSQENTICSNRGLCDFETGVCKCFNGFTDDDCSVQNALAMY